MTWRQTVAPIIADVIRAVGTDDPTKLRKALADAYPFGERKYHPYKVWRDEIKRQLGRPLNATKPKTDGIQTSIF
ncbi:hypothetical protein PL263_10470 [Methylomonas sp. EFPC3]|uniref:hypothetical protein n=1 Tax=Methylomonas sp. EFPC3 TaxID=3021710 RepID=UPI002416D873|nr:hypothetical protein [Methylomonas sp. EFPC3]WFP48537.1 hypothetical protein PL263_10470 [Methylomonas sp. EFPC3]